MANAEHVELLTEDSEDWNEWRSENPTIVPDLRAADLSDLDLKGADLSNAEISGASFSETDLTDADLSGAHAVKADFISSTLCFANLTAARIGHADFTRANLDGANLSHCNGASATFGHASLVGADMRNSNFARAKLFHANIHGGDLRAARLEATNLVRANLTCALLNEADLSGANLHGAQLIETDLQDAVLTGCRVYGVSAWGVKLERTDQRNLVITPRAEQTITVDDLEIAQFVYLLLSNHKIRNVIDTIGRKAVLILGRFTPERKLILDTLREELRKQDYVPMLFDFEGPSNRDISETVSTLAHMARFIVADITDAKSIPQELMLIVPNLPSVPVQPLLLSSRAEYGMFEHFRRYPWVLDTFCYDDVAQLCGAIKERVINPAESKLAELLNK